MIHFHGKITYNCNQEPLRNTYLAIYREFDTGTLNADFVTGCLTDENGFYSKMSEVKLRGSLVHYDIIVKGNSPFLGSQGFCTSGKVSDDIEINCELKPRKAYSFHIKNVSPFNNLDLFNTLTISYPESSFHPDVIISNLLGMNTDTIVFINRYSSPLYYSVAYTKNGLYTETLLDSINSPACLDTMQVDIFY